MKYKKGPDAVMYATVNANNSKIFVFANVVVSQYFNFIVFARSIFVKSRMIGLENSESHCTSVKVCYF